MAEALGSIGHRSGSLRLEITESVLMDRIDEAADVLSGCAASACGSAMDDFGTGYSSLSYLHRLPVDVLRRWTAPSGALASGGKAEESSPPSSRWRGNLGRDLVAEGVETADR